MKKVSLFILLLLACLLPAAFAEEETVAFTSGDYKYILLEDGTAEITDYSGNESELQIPSLLDEYTVTSIGDSAFRYCESLTSVTIPDGVTVIGDTAFVLCTSLTSVTIPDSVTVIGDGAFILCTSLTSITIPDGVTEIGDGAFAMCESLTSVTIPAGVSSMGANPFAYCRKLTNIKVSPMSKYFETIDGVLFEKSTKKLICFLCAFTAENYAIPQGILAIGDYAFDSCTSLTNITIPDSVTSIGDGAFNDCESLTSVTIPDSVTVIGDDAFYDCKALVLTVDPGSYAESYAEQNGIEYTYTNALD